MTAAALYDEHGRRFAVFRRGTSGDPLSSLAPLDGLAYRGPLVEIALPVMEAKRFGTLFVRADLSVIHERVAGYGLVLVGTTFLSGLLAYLLTGLIARQIVAPVRHTSSFKRSSDCTPARSSKASAWA